MTRSTPGPWRWSSSPTGTSGRSRSAWAAPAPALAGGTDADLVVEDARVAAAEIAEVEGPTPPPTPSPTSSSWPGGSVIARAPGGWGRWGETTLPASAATGPGRACARPSCRRRSSPTRTTAVCRSTTTSDASCRRSWRRSSPTISTALEFTASTRASAAAFLAKDPPTATVGAWRAGPSVTSSASWTAYEDSRLTYESEGNFELVGLDRRHLRSLPGPARTPRRGRRRHGPRPGEPAPGARAVERGVPAARGGLAHRLRPRRHARLTRRRSCCATSTANPDTRWATTRRGGHQRVPRRRRRSRGRGPRRSWSRSWWGSSSLRATPRTTASSPACPCTPCGSWTAPTTST